MKYIGSIAPSKFFEAYNHSPFSRFLGFSGHKEMFSVKVAMCFMDSVSPNGFLFSFLHFYIYPEGE